LGATKSGSVGGNSDPKKFHLFVCGKASNLNDFSWLQILATPDQLINVLVGLSAATVIQKPIHFERAVVHLL